MRGRPIMRVFIPVTPSQDQEATVIPYLMMFTPRTSHSTAGTRLGFIGPNGVLFDHSSSEPLHSNPDSSHSCRAESADSITTNRQQSSTSAPISTLEGDSVDLPMWKVAEGNQSTNGGS
jgi:hypothetical protein